MYTVPNEVSSETTVWMVVLSVYLIWTRTCVNWGSTCCIKTVLVATVVLVPSNVMVVSTVPGVMFSGTGSSYVWITSYYSLVTTMMILLS